MFISPASCPRTSIPKLLSTGSVELTPILTLRFSSSMLEAVDKSIVLNLRAVSISLSSSLSAIETSSVTSTSSPSCSTSSCFSNSTTTLLSVSVTLRMCLSSLFIDFSSSFVNKGCFSDSLESKLVKSLFIIISALYACFYRHFLSKWLICQFNVVLFG